MIGVIVAANVTIAPSKLKRAIELWYSICCQGSGYGDRSFLNISTAPVLPGSSFNDFS